MANPLFLKNFSASVRHWSYQHVYVLDWNSISLLFNLYHQIVAIFKNFVANLMFYHHPKILNRISRLCWSRHSLFMYSIGIALHFFSICIIKSLPFLKILLPIWRFIIIQRFSTGSGHNVNLVFSKPRLHCMRSMLGVVVMLKCP